MATHPDIDWYHEVSSFYGPGTTACWYLTVISCLISWTIHPKKRKSDSIDTDLIAVLTFPAVASGHLITQVYTRKWFTPKSNLVPLLISFNDPQLEASLVITETSLVIFAISLIIAVWFRSWRRMAAVASTSLLCICAETYLFSKFRKHFKVHPNHDFFERPFLVDFDALLISIDVAVGILILISAGLLWAFISGRAAASALPISERRRDDSASQKSKYANSWTLLSYMLLPVSFLMLATPLTMSSISSGFTVPVEAGSGSRSYIVQFGNRFVQDIVPHSAAQLAELDQAVAVFAGAVVLCFSIFSAAKANLRLYSEQQRRPERELHEETISSRRLHFYHRDE